MTMGVQVDCPNSPSVDNDFASPLRRLCERRESETASNRRKPGQRTSGVAKHLSTVCYHLRSPVHRRHLDSVHRSSRAPRCDRLVLVRPFVVPPALGLAVRPRRRQNAATSEQVDDGADEGIAPGGLSGAPGKGELAYQWSPEAGKAVFYPRVICPFTGSDRLEWRISAGSARFTRRRSPIRARARPTMSLSIDCDEGFRLMSRVEDIAPEAVQIGMRVTFRVHRPGGDDPTYPVFIPLGSRVMDGLQRGVAAIVGVAESDLGAVATGDEPDRSDGARRSSGRLPIAVCGLRDVDGLVCATTQSRTSGLAWPNISASRPPLSIRRSSAARLSCSMSRTRGGAAARPVQGRGHRLWQHPAHDRPPARLGARIQSLRDPVPAVSAVDRLCAGGLAPHAPIRHDPRATGRRSRWRRGNGHCSTRWPGKRSR